jgi:hypothetical protein
LGKDQKYFETSAALERQFHTGREHRASWHLPDLYLCVPNVGNANIGNANIENANIGNSNIAIKKVYSD